MTARETITNTNTSDKIVPEHVPEQNAIRYYFFMPSLQHFSAVKVITSLWNRAGIQNEIVELIKSKKRRIDSSSTQLDSFWKNVEESIFDKLLQLSLPNAIRKLLSSIVNPIGQEILEWIRYQIMYILCEFVKPSVAISFMDYLVWTSTGTINYKATARCLLAKSELTDYEKYKVACIYCVEDMVSNLFLKIVPICGDIIKEPMENFWTSHLKKSAKDLNKVVAWFNVERNTNYSVIECLFQILINTHYDTSRNRGTYNRNYVAIKYMWNKLGNQEKSRQIVKAVKLCNTDLQCFFLSQMSNHQQQKVFKSCASKILLCLLDDWLWEKYFLPTMHHIWNVIPESHYLSVLNDIVGRIDQNQLNSDKYNHYTLIFKELWQYAPKHLKEYILKFSRGRNMILKLFSLKDVEIVQFILLDANDAQKKEITFSTNAYKKCCFFVTNNKWDSLENLIVLTLFSVKDINEFKQELVYEKGDDIVIQLIQNKQWDEVHKFLKWAFESDNWQEMVFRKEIVYSRIYEDILENMEENNKADFTELEHFLKWCASGEEEMFIKFKAEIPMSYIIKLIKEDKFEWLDNILNWCFVNDPKEISYFKQEFYFCFVPESVTDLVHDLVERNDQYESLDKFLYYWCRTDEEVNNFKTCILRPQYKSLGFCINLLMGRKFEIADKLVNWCFNSSQPLIDNFKSRLLTSDQVDILFDFANCKNVIVPTIMWFNPSKYAMMELKEKFVDASWLEKVLSAITIYVQEKALKSDINNILQDLLSDVENQDSIDFGHVGISSTKVISE